MRGIGILGVMLTHFAYPSLKAFGLGAFFEAVAWGMPMFFLLSGFLITGILLEAREKPHYFRNFFVRRVLRIFPLYYGVLLVLFLIHPAWGRAAGGASSPRWLWLYASNIEMAVKDGWTYGYLSHFWSLAVEEQYYIFWPFIVLAVRPRRLLAVCAALGVFSFVLRIVLTAGSRNAIGAYVLTPCQLDPLAAGGALAVLVRQRPLERYRTLARCFVIASLAIYFLFGWHRMGMMSRPLLVFRPLVSCFLFGGILLLAIGESGFFRSVLGARPFTFLGKYSYGIYVFHHILVPVFRDGFPSGAIGRRIGSYLGGIAVSTLLSILGSLVLAIASYELYEKRFLRLKSRFGSA